MSVPLESTSGFSLLASTHLLIERLFTESSWKDFPLQGVLHYMPCWRAGKAGSGPLLKPFKAKGLSLGKENVMLLPNPS